MPDYRIVYEDELYHYGVKGMKSDAAKAYNKNYDQASRLSDAADKKWAASKSAYKETGSNLASRVYNNIQYDRKKKKR